MMALFVGEILRFFVGFLLLAAAAGKLRAAAGFRLNLETSFGMPAARARMVAPMLIGAEVLVAAMVLGPWNQAGMLAALLMFAAFTLVVTHRFFTQPTVRCSCFGETGRPLSGYDLLRNLLVIGAIAAFLAVAPGAAASWSLMFLAAGLASFMAVAAIEFHGIATLLVEA
ncbi:MAG: MauE/DoxX family redox-associated membrane protein [Pseudomonadota bacterium]